VPHRQRAGPKRHYCVTGVDEELKGIFKKCVFRTRLKSVNYVGDGANSVTGRPSATSRPRATGRPRLTSA